MNTQSLYSSAFPLAMASDTSAVSLGGTNDTPPVLTHGMLAELLADIARPRPLNRMASGPKHESRTILSELWFLQLLSAPIPQLLTHYVRSAPHRPSANRVLQHRLHLLLSDQS